MAILTNVASVRELVTTGLSDEAIRHNFIVTANVWREHLLDESGLSTSLLGEIEKYLAAHLVAVAEEKGGLIRETLGDATDAYSDNYSSGLGATRFGQIATTLDTTGVLAAKGTAKQKAEFRIV